MMKSVHSLYWGEERRHTMIITQKKPVEELLAMLEGVTKVAIVGCGQCAAACQTGGSRR